MRPFFVRLVVLDNLSVEVPHFEPMLWLLWFIVILLFRCAFFCVMWWVHIPRTFIGKVKKIKSPVFKW